MPVSPRPPDAQLLETLGQRLGLTTLHPVFGLAALTHKSYVNEHRDEGADNERLEFLGDAVVEAIERHRAFLESTGQRAERERARARMQFLALLRDRLLESALGTLEAQKGRLDEVALSISRREADPYALADTLAQQLSS